MPIYTVHLKSPTNSQARHRTLEAESPEQATKIALDLEDKRVAFNLLEQRPVRGVTIAEHAEGVNALVNASAFRDSGLSGYDLLEFCQRDHAVDGDGKTYGPNNVIREHLAAHHQKQPYEVVSCDVVMPNVGQIIDALKSLQGNQKAWKRLLDRLKDEDIPLAVVTGSLYGLTAQAMIDGSTPIVWSSATIKGALTTSTYTPNQDTHHFFSDVTNEVASSGTYVNPGGVAIGTKTSTYDTATDQIRLGSAAWSVTGTTITARRFVLQNDTAGASTTDPVMGWLDFGADVSTTNGTFQVTPDPTGWIVYDVT